MRILAILLLCACAVPAWAQERIGRVAAVRGEVTLVRGDAETSADAGVFLLDGDRIVTGPNGRALLQLDGGLAVTVANATDLALRDLRRGGREASFHAWLDLLSGLVRAALNTPATTNDVEIRTPLAVTSVRSTEWTVEHESEHTAVFCRDGVVTVRANEGTVRLAAGDGTDVRGTERPTEPVAWGAPRVERTLARSSLVGR